MGRPIESGSDAARIVAEEQSLLERVSERLTEAQQGDGIGLDYDRELLDLRDQVAEAKPEDVAPLVEQMTRASAIAARRGRGRELPIDPASPYFAHLRLREGGRERDVLIGKRGLIDRAAGVQIVDWRNAPVSRIYYRYDEGDDFDEQLPGGRLEGTVEARRNVAIAASRLRRIGCPQGTFVADVAGRWYQAEGQAAPLLRGGQGTAARPPRPEPPRRRPGRLGVDSGPVPRADKRLPEIAALIDRDQFDLITQPDAGLVVIEGGAGSGKTTVALHRVAYLHFQNPGRFKARRMLVVVPSAALERYVAGVLPALGVHDVPVVTVRGWMRWARRRIAPHAPDRYADDTPAVVARAKKHPALLAALEQYALQAKAAAAASDRKRPLPTTVWAELLTDRGRLREALPWDEFSDADLARLCAWCSAQQDSSTSELLRDIEDPERAAPVDGRPLDEGEVAGRLDVEDDPLLLRLAQVLRGNLSGPSGERPLVYEHIAIDEAQDLSVAEVKVLLESTTTARSVTVCGDSAQRLVFDNGFTSFDALLGEAGYSRQVVRPLGLSYRSTAEVMRLARAVLGPLAPPAEPAARPGEPVELHRFDEMGPAVAFLAEALRSLMGREPIAQVALLSRHAAQADGWYAALAQAEVPALRRVRRDDFSFKPGIDVTDVAQVKGLEFDYVVLLDVGATSYPPTLESRHLLHIGATRAAHQLWLLAIGTPSPLLPPELVSAALPEVAA
jgi:DNA helicase-2/ATP-dependent DNA helicase PcrA